MSELSQSKPKAFFVGAGMRLFELFFISVVVTAVLIFVLFVLVAAVLIATVFAAAILVFLVVLSVLFVFHKDLLKNRGRQTLFNVVYRLLTYAFEG